jgi:hypothetical protein
MKKPSRLIPFPTFDEAGSGIAIVGRASAYAGSANGAQMLNPSAPPRMKIDTITSRDVALLAMTTLGSQAGKNAAALTPAAAPRNWRRESSLYS